ncbi:MULTISPECIES: SCO3870 family protein [Streptomyces]|uniref:SCO3870 family protein n=1 Tax=Streptomyces luteosporeus TaxID=173856 RepID=A0ABP6G5Q9_9ACTN
MKKLFVVAMTTALAVLGTALVLLAFQLRAQGYEQYVEQVTFLAGTVYFTAGMTVVTWFRARRTPLS